MAQSNVFPKDQFLLISANLLHRTFVDVPRTQAKGTFRRIEAGGVLPITNIKLGNGNVVTFVVAL